jgi:hypothetical protein
MLTAQPGPRRLHTAAIRSLRESNLLRAWDISIPPEGQFGKEAPPSTDRGGVSWRKNPQTNTASLSRHQGHLLKRRKTDERVSKG